MENKKLIPPHQIIMFVVFISAALISSLFIFHLTHKIKTPLIDSQYGTLFPVAREINHFELITSNKKNEMPQKFTLNHFYHHWTLLFFGFTHCADICPATLASINHIYPALKKAYPNLQVVFISIDPERDSPAVVANYVHTFNPDFKGVTGNRETIRQLQSQFGIYVERKDDAGSSTHQFMHTASIFLIDPQGKWAGLFNQGLPSQALAQAFNTSVQAITHG